MVTATATAERSSAATSIGAIVALWRYPVKSMLGEELNAAERARSDPNWRVVELADNHLAAVNNPQATAEALVSLV